MRSERIEKPERRLWYPQKRGEKSGLIMTGTL